MNNDLWKARDRAWKLARERNQWKAESLEQAKLLAISADREEKLRAALRRIADTHPSQICNDEHRLAVLLATGALQ
jgi:hypothetical protein